MKFVNLLDLVDADEVVDLLNEFYPKTVKNNDEYHEVLSTLSNVPASECDLKISIKHMSEFGNEWDHVHGIDDRGDVFAVQFMPWDEWLAAEIDERALDSYGEAGTVAHCLWEMTFNGFDEDTIQSELKQLNDTVKELNEQYA